MLAVQTAGTDYSNVFLPLVGTSEFGLVLKSIAENSAAKQESQRRILWSILKYNLFYKTKTPWLQGVLKG
jgi:hypothetical protein